jgi:copper chaperone CopZ
MRLLICALLTGCAMTASVAAQGAGDKVEVKGPHLCCKQCVNVANKLLANVAGVSDVSADVKTKTITFKARDEAAAKAGVKAIFDGGFYGAATQAGKQVSVVSVTPAKGTKAEAVTVNDVHVCCGACQKAINKLFPDATISYDGSGPQRTVRIIGKDLDAGAVVEALRQAGFNGSAQ